MSRTSAGAGRQRDRTALLRPRELAVQGHGASTHEEFAPDRSRRRRGTIRATTSWRGSGRLQRPQWDARLAETRAMEGTVLRVPCAAPERQWAPPTSQGRPHRGFWRSSVRGLGPPASDHSPAGSRRPPREVRRDEPADATHGQQVEAFARRGAPARRRRCRCALSDHVVNPRCQRHACR